GIDRDPAMIAQARINFPQVRFQLADAAEFTVQEPVDAVFSNAALHWVTEPVPAVAAIAAALRTGGRFVAEFGGKGNVDAVLEAMRSCIPEAKSPWFFPSVAEYAGILERQGLAVSFAHLFHRPTPLEGEDGMRDWLQMFGAKFFESVPPERRFELLGQVETLLRGKLWRDNGWVIDYKRLRVVAIKGA
ncbi:MAG: methyltransferase domain-containing protein, partial [Acidobacteriota bacterium]|nr:methyltransferase domain-containing protein [Acidobacteriota bacterium]